MKIFSFIMINKPSHPRILGLEIKWSCIDMVKQGDLTPLIQIIIDFGEARSRAGETNVGMD